MRDYNALSEKIKTKSAKVGIIGLGYVGLPLAVAFAKKGFQVSGFVKNKKKVEDLQKGINYS
jgi:UDP-N-acetyl-D-glucosamine dehydrogenase